MTTGGAKPVAGLYEVADGVYIYTITGFIMVNTGIIVGDDAVAVVDTGTTESDARSLLHAVASVTDKPVRYVINTHYHGDHSFGNWWFLPAITVGHERCRLKLVGDEGTSHRDTMASHLPMIREQVQAVPVTPPAVTFQNFVDLHLGNIDLKLAYLGRAHTDNDIAIGVEGADLAFAGDLIEQSGPPIAGEGFPNEWGPTLRKLGAAMVDRYVPGHGLIVDSMFVSDQASAFETLSRTCAGVESAAEAMEAMPDSVVNMLETQTPAAIERYFETVTN